MSTDHVRFGVLPPVTGQGHPELPRHLLDLAVQAEQLGFDSFWAGDSLLRARVEPLTLLSHVSALTAHITIGTAAMIPAYRQPISAAQAIASLDLFSAGRLVLGVGAGFPGRSDPEFRLAGIPTVGRSARLDDIAALWRMLWSGSPVRSFRGAVLDFDDLPAGFQTHRPGGPPIWLAAGNPAALGRAGRLYDGWLPYPPSAGDYADGLEVVRAAAANAQRRPPAAALFVTIAVADTVEQARQVLDHYCLANYGLPLHTVESIQTFIAGPAERVRAELELFSDAGARHFVIRLPAVRPAAQQRHLHAIADTVLKGNP